MLVLKIPKEHKMSIVSRMQAYFGAEFSQPVGNLAAEHLLHFMVEQLGPVIYNQAINDARAVVTQQMERIDEELYAIEQPLQPEVRVRPTTED